MIGPLRRACFRSKTRLFNLLVKTLIQEGTSSSYFWKVQRGEPLTEEEERQKVQFEEDRELFKSMEHTLRSSGRLLRQLDLFDELIANLPQEMRDELRATEGPAYGAKLVEFLKPR